MMSCSKSVLEMTTSRPKNRAEDTQELSGWGWVRTGKVQSGRGEPHLRQGVFSPRLTAMVWART